jgi:hypothetical protein
VTAPGSIVTDFWHDQLVAHGRQGLFLVLVGFLGSFAFIRLSTRLMRSPRVPWWPGSVVSDSGVHIHHLVFGVALMLIAGTLGFWFLDDSPWLEVSALLFGIGAGLTFDEFALLVHLEDVYWSREGRTSVDATAIAVAAMGLIFLGARPFDITTDDAWDTVSSAAVGLLVLALVATCFAKQRLMLGTIGFFLLPVAIYGSIRLGRPGSPWARRRYSARNAGKQARAESRFHPDRLTQRLTERVRDAVGGTTREVFEAKIAEDAARSEAAAEVRRRADRVAAGGTRRDGPG